jgi:hypothetical protein
MGVNPANLAAILAMLESDEFSLFSEKPKVDADLLKQMLRKRRALH